MGELLFKGSTVRPLLKTSLAKRLYCYFILGGGAACTMLPLSITRNRKADREQKVHNRAVQKALERKAIREFVKANPDVLTDEEDLQDHPVPKSSESSSSPAAENKNSDHFFDVCNEKINALSIKEKREKKPEKKLLKKAGGGAAKSKKAKKSKKLSIKEEALTEHSEETVPKI